MTEHHSSVDSTLQAKAYRVIRTRTQHCLEKRKLNPTLWSLLITVAGARDGIRLTEVAKLLGVKAPLITMMADQLIERAYITRVQHQLDKRAKLLLITPTGKKLVASITAEVEETLAPLLKGVSAKELGAFHKVLSAIVDNS